MLYYVCIHDGFVLYIYNIVTVCALDHSCLTPWIPRMDQAARCGLSCAYTWPRSRRCHLIGGEVSPNLTHCHSGYMGYESNLTQIGPETWHFGGSQFRLSTEIKIAKSEILSFPKHFSLCMCCSNQWLNKFSSNMVKYVKCYDLIQFQKQRLKAPLSWEWLKHPIFSPLNNGMHIPFLSQGTFSLPTRCFINSQWGASKLWQLNGLISKGMDLLQGAVQGGDIPKLVQASPVSIVREVVVQHVVPSQGIHLEIGHEIAPARHCKVTMKGCWGDLLRIGVGKLLNITETCTYTSIYIIVCVYIYIYDYIYI